MSAGATIGVRPNSSPGQAGLASPVEAGRLEPQITTLQWAVGLFCALTGALMVVAPHQFSGPIWSALQGQLPWVGSLFFLAGVALIGCVALGVPRSWVVASHFIAAAALLSLVYNLALVGLLPGAVCQVVFAVSTVLSPFIACPERPGRPNTGYLLALVFGVINAIHGLMMLLLPAQLRSPIFDPIRPYLWLYGTAFLVTSAALMFVQFRPRLPAPLFQAAHLAILIPSVGYALAVPIPSATWTGIIIYCGLSPLVALLPWIGPHLRRVDAHSFSFRLAFTLALAAALPLIVILGLVTGEQERLARAEAEARLAASAASMASDISHYMAAYRSSLVALAAYPGLLAGRSTTTAHPRPGTCA